MVCAEDNEEIRMTGAEGGWWRAAGSMTIKHKYGQLLRALETQADLFLLLPLLRNN